MKKQLEVSLEKQLEVLKIALELGGNVAIRFHSFSVGNAEEAENLVKGLSSRLGIDYEHGHANESRDGVLTNWYKADEFKSQVNITAFYNTYEKEETA